MTPIEIATLLGGIAPRQIVGTGPIAVTDFAVMLAVFDGPKVVNEIQQIIGWKVAPTSERITALVRRGFLERTRDERDPRRNVISLTPKGIRVVRSGRNPP